MISSSRENTCVCTLKNRIITRTHHVCIFILLHIPANVMCRLWQRMLHLSRTDVTLVWINSYTNKYACIRCDYKCRKFWYSLLKLYITVANLHSVSIYISNLFVHWNYDKFKVSQKQVLATLCVLECILKLPFHSAAIKTLSRNLAQMELANEILEFRNLGFGSK